ncbi:hypothetical protein D9M71_622860 [compost metagenome]
MIVVQYQQQRRISLQVQRQLIEQAVEPLFECERLMALAHFQQAHGLAAQCRAVLLQAFKQALKEAARVGVPLAQAKPQATPVLGQCFAKLDGQGAFAETCRGIDQQQPPAQTGFQPLAQTQALHMAIRQRRPEETPVPQAKGLTRESMRTGQICHGRLVLVGRQRRYGCLRD